MYICKCPILHTEIKVAVSETRAYFWIDSSDSITLAICCSSHYFHVLVIGNSSILCVHVHACVFVYELE